MEPKRKLLFFWENHESTPGPCGTTEVHSWQEPQTNSPGWHGPGGALFRWMFTEMLQSCLGIWLYVWMPCGLTGSQEHWLQTPAHTKFTVPCLGFPFSQTGSIAVTYGITVLSQSPGPFLKKHELWLWMQPKSKFRNTFGLKAAPKSGEASGSILFSSCRSSGTKEDRQLWLAWESCRNGGEMVTFILFIKPILEGRWVSVPLDKRIALG